MAITAKGQLPLRLPAIISDHAVLQRGANVKLWGWGPGSMAVHIVCSWNERDTIVAPIAADCAWEATVKTPGAGGPWSIRFICGEKKIAINDIMTGDVWLCSGQSNMEFNYKWGIADAGRAASPAANNKIRFFEVRQNYDKYERSNCEGEWKVCKTDTMPEFSAIGYFFGLRLNEQLKTPVGLIGAYWQGTCIQAWMPAHVFANDTVLRKMTTNIEPYGWAPKGASVLYNAMINPIAGYKISGVLWYQGEANVSSEYKDYGKLLAALISSWRKEFGIATPFYYVQIAPWSGYDGIKSAFLREQQEAVLALPETGMVVISDLTDNVTDIHPKRKREVGLRLANLVLKEQYNFDLRPYYPRFKSFSIANEKAILTVTSYGILHPPGGQITNFQLAGADKVFYPALARIAKDGRIIITAGEVKNPVAIRYCFNNTMIPNLFDVNSLPLAPFRTDKW